MSPEAIAESKEQARRYALAMSLRELRKDAGLTQDETAAQSAIAQSTLSKIENGGQVPTTNQLRACVRAFGFELEVVAVKGDKRITLAGV
jgi:transcriptional regulator with XRE-family HTH domain